MAEIHLKVLRLARKRIHDRRNVQLCVALMELAANRPGLGHAVEDVREFIRQNLGESATYRGWLCRNHPPAAEVLRDPRQSHIAHREMRLYRLRVIDEVLRPHFENF